MGTSQSKEEVIIAQAGNSGGQTNKTDFLSIQHMVEIAFLVLGVIAIVAYCLRKCKKLLRKSIQEQIRASQELV